MDERDSKIIKDGIVLRDDSKEAKKEIKGRDYSSLTSLLEHPQPAGVMTSFLGPHGARAFMRVSTEARKVAGGNVVWNEFVDAPFRAGDKTEDHREKKKKIQHQESFSDTPLNSNVPAQAMTSSTETKDKKNYPLHSSYLKALIVKEQTDEEKKTIRLTFNRKPLLRSRKYYPTSFWLGSEAISFFETILERDPQNLEAQSGLAFYNFISYKRTAESQVSDLRKILGILTQHPDHANSIYYLAKVIADNLCPHNLRSEVTEVCQKIVGPNSRLDAMALYRAALKIDPYHPRANYGLASFLKAAQRNPNFEDRVLPGEEKVAFRAQLLRNAWTVSEDFGPLWDFLELIESNQIEPTEEDFFHLNEKIKVPEHFVNPTKTLEKYEVFIDYINSKYVRVGSWPDFIEMSGRLDRDRSILQRILDVDKDRWSGYTKSLIDRIEILPRHQQLCLLNAAGHWQDFSIPGVRDVLFDKFFYGLMGWVGIEVFMIWGIGSGLYEIDSNWPNPFLLICGMIACVVLLVFGVGGSLFLRIKNQDLTQSEEDRLIVLSITHAINGNLPLFFPGLDPEKAIAFIQLKTIPESKRNGIDGHFSTSQQNNICSAIQRGEALFHRRMVLAQVVEKYLPFFMALSVCASSGYGLYKTMQIDFPVGGPAEQLIFQTGAGAAGVILAILLSDMAYRLTKALSSTLTHHVQELQQEAIVAEVRSVVSLQ